MSAPIRSAAELAALVSDLGFLPAFRNHIPGFSAEERIAPEFWFPEQGDGFWEWKGPVIRMSGCAYGKLLGGRAVFVRPELYRELANYRRDGYDFDARFEDGLAQRRDKQVFDVLWEQGSLLSSELSRLCAGRRDLSEIMTRLQMQGYAVISDFEYRLNKRGEPYGWGVTRYETPERRFGPSFREQIYARSPEDSKALLLDHLSRLLPAADEKSLLRLVG